MHLDLSPEPHMHYTRAALDHNNRPIATTVKGLDGKPMRVSRDKFSGKYYVQIAQHRPTEDSPSAKALRDAIDKQKPLHFSSDKPGLTGYWVEIKDHQIPLSASDRAKADAALGNTEGFSSAAPEEVPDYSQFNVPGAAGEAGLQEIKDAPKA